MDVRDAVASRRSVRGFLPTPIAVTTLKHVIEGANHAPSGGNLQPWNIAVLAGNPLQNLKHSMAATYGTTQEPPEYEIYPANLPEPYRTRRFTVGEQLYGHLGIVRENQASRRQWLGHNYQFFGAPAAVFVHMPRYMGPPQWSDLGMWMQSFMLLLRAEGLHSCPQEAWALYSRTLRQFVPIPEEHVFFAAIAVGLEDPSHPANGLRAPRAPIEEIATFIGFDEHG